jgi:hypothetical protein
MERQLNEDLKKHASDELKRWERNTYDTYRRVSTDYREAASVIVGLLWYEAVVGAVACGMTDEQIRTGIDLVLKDVRNAKNDGKRYT